MNKYKSESWRQIPDVTKLLPSQTYNVVGTFINSVKADSLLLLPTQTTCSVLTNKHDMDTKKIKKNINQLQFESDASKENCK